MRSNEVARQREIPPEQDKPQQRRLLLKSGEIRDAHRKALRAPITGRTIKHAGTAMATKLAVAVIGEIPFRQFIPIPADQ